MKVKKQISRLSQIILLLTFFLPFFPKGCDSGNEFRKQQYLKDSLLLDSIKRVEMLHFVDSVSKVDPTANTDSILVARNAELAKNDSIKFKSYSDSIRLSDSAASQKDTVNRNDNSNKLAPTEYLSKKSKLLKVLLRPGDNNFTGIGFLIDMFLVYLIYFGTWTAFLLFILGLIIKYKDLNFNLINIVAWLFLLFTNPNGNSDNLSLKFWEDKLWGYWFCLVLGLILITYDLIISGKIKENKTGA